MELTKTDEAKLKRVHPDMQAVVRRAAQITDIPFRILESDRTLAQQRENIRKKVSWTLHSRHIISPSGLVYAVDIAPLVNGQPTFAWPVYFQLAKIIKKAAAQIKVPVEWGGDWKKTPDGPHWQLPWKRYPAK